jgi:hypothetical protein
MQNQVDSWGLKCLGSQIGFFMGSLEVSEGKKKSDPTSMPAEDPIIGMNSKGTGAVVGAGSLQKIQ